MTLIYLNCIQTYETQFLFIMLLINKMYWFYFISVIHYNFNLYLHLNKLFISQSLIHNCVQNSLNFEHFN